MLWVYDLPNWMFGVLTIALFVAFGLTGLAATRAWVPSLHHESHSHNDVVGAYLGAITVFYGITLGLLMVGVWGTYSDAEVKVDSEAATMAALYRDVTHYPEPVRGRLQEEMRTITRQVIDLSWPQQRAGIMPKASLAEFTRFEQDLLTFEPVTEGQKILHAQAIHQFNQLVERRRSRVLSVKAGLSGSLWALVLIGAAINIALTWLFHVQKARMHFCLTVLTSSLLGLMIFLLAAMDHPYRGKLSVGPEAFEMVYERTMKPGT
jgi:Protein of unknown function (DUF4239)